jgi:putative flavoprotein involved in K+ transport
MTHDHADVLIVGGGQSGLAAAYAARQAGLAPVLLEAGEEPAGSWPHYYDSLTLFSPARYSELPGRPFGGDPDRYPTRDELTDYLRAYASELDADIRTGRRVRELRALDGGGFSAVTDSGLELTADLAIAATGGFGTPHHPALPLDAFTGDVLHAAEYRSPTPYAGRRVVVVGGGNSAVQIAAELADVARVTIATRSPLKFTSQRPLGHDLHWWLTYSGLDAAPIGRWLRGRTTPVLDDGRYRDALATGNPDARAMFLRLDRDHAVWSDGKREPVDAVILATGYRPNLAYLAGTGALDASGQPLHRAGVSSTVPGLGYVGLEYQRSIASATVRGVGRDAKRVTAGLVAQRGRSTASRRDAILAAAHRLIEQATG